MRTVFVLFLILAAAGCNLSANRQNLDGRRNFEMGNYNGALNSFQLALSANPANADAHYNIGRTMHVLAKRSGQKSQLQLAEQAYRSALALNPTHQPAYRGLAVLLAENKRPREAFDLLQGWVMMQPDSAEPRVELARLYREYGDRKTATQLLSDALVVDSTNDRALRAMGSLREESGDIRQALTDYQRSLQLNPMQPGLATRVANLQLRSGTVGIYSHPPRQTASLPDFPRYR